MKSIEPALRGIVFDLDGVIVDSHPLHKRAWRAFLGELGREVSDADLGFILEGRCRREILVHFLGELSESEIEQYGKKKDEFFRQVSADLMPVTGSVELIQSLLNAEIELAVATSASRQRAHWTLNQLGIENCFKVVVTGDDVEKGKPDPTIYRLATEGLSLSPQFLLAVEDSLSGIYAARSAELRCLGIGVGPTKKLMRDAGVKHVLPNLAGLSITKLKAMYSGSIHASEPVARVRFPSA
jgi:HAD superfamily hydrolase (TIGR01509 family)